MRYEGEQLFPGDATAPAGAAAVLLIAMNVAPEAEAEFNEWYNTEHIPALAASGACCRPAATAVPARNSAMPRSIT